MQRPALQAGYPAVLGPTRGCHSVGWPARSPARRRRRLCAAHEGAYLARGQQFDLVAHGAKAARPLVRTTAGFHGHAGGPQGAEELDELGSAELAPADLAAAGIDPVQLHDVLGRIHGVSRSIHGGASVFKWLIKTSTLALDAVRCEAPPVQRRWGSLPAGGKGGGMVGGVHTISISGLVANSLRELRSLRSDNRDEVRARGVLQMLAMGPALLSAA